MNKKENIEQEIQKTLEQFNQVDQLPPNPYFYTRVQARLEETRRQQTVLSAVLKPALLTALVVVNFSTAFWYLDGTIQTEQNETRQELVELLANDFNPDNNQTDILNLK